MNRHAAIFVIGPDGAGKRRQYLCSKCAAGRRAEILGPRSCAAMFKLLDQEKLDLACSVCKTVLRPFPGRMNPKKPKPRRGKGYERAKQAREDAAANAALHAEVTRAREKVQPKKKNPAITDGQVAEGQLRYRLQHWGKGGTQRPRQLSAANPFAAAQQPVVIIGRLVALEYETDKLGDGMSIYRHEVTSRDATLAAVKNGRLVIGGEKIKMTVRGIVG